MLDNLEAEDGIEAPLPEPEMERALRSKTAPRMLRRRELDTLQVYIGADNPEGTQQSGLCRNPAANIENSGSGSDAVLAKRSCSRLVSPVGMQTRKAEHVRWDDHTVRIVFLSMKELPDFRFAQVPAPAANILQLDSAFPSSGVPAEDAGKTTVESWTI